RGGGTAQSRLHAHSCRNRRPDRSPASYRTRRSRRHSLLVTVEGTMGSVRPLWTHRRPRRTGRAHRLGSGDLLGRRLNQPRKNPQSRAKAVAQSVQTFGYFLSGVTCHVLCAGINFYAGYYPCLDDGLNEGSAIFLLLADGLVIEDCATNALTETGGSHNQLAIGAPGLLGLRNPQLCKSFIAGRITLIHCQQ